MFRIAPGRTFPNRSSILVLGLLDEPASSKFVVFDHDDHTFLMIPFGQSNLKSCKALLLFVDVSVSGLSYLN